jgi:prepilin-type N-terminal cleavage/methylation domain-containing protein
MTILVILGPQIGCGLGVMSVGWIKLLLIFLFLSIAYMVPNTGNPALPPRPIVGSLNAFNCKERINSDLNSAIPGTGSGEGAFSTMRKQSGFSLIELLIVVAIILIIAAIAIPSLLRSRMLANQSAAVSSVRTINTAQVTYQGTYGIGFADSLVSLGPGIGNLACPAAGPSSNGACLIDGILGASNPSTKQQYQYQVTSTSGAGVPGDPILDYVVSATPLSLTTSGSLNFCSMGSDLVIRVNGPPPATAPVTAVATCAGYSALKN